MRRRLDRKLHRFFLELGVQDASQITSWRERARDGDLDVEHPIDAAHCAGLPRSVKRGLGRHGLRFTMARVAAVPPEIEAQLGFPGCVWLRFRAARYPDIVCWAATSALTVG